MRLTTLPGDATRAFIRSHPVVNSAARVVKKELEFLFHTTALLFPSIIEPDPTEIYQH